MYFSQSTLILIFYLAYHSTWPGSPKRNIFQAKEDKVCACDFVRALGTAAKVLPNAHTQVHSLNEDPIGLIVALMGI